jgi:hypothetical protein
MPKIAQFTVEQIAKAKAYAASTPPADLDPRIEALVNDLIGRVADKWTMIILEVLAEKGRVAIHAFERTGRRRQPEDADADLAANGAGRIGGKDRASGRATESRIQPDGQLGLESGRGILWGMGVGGRKSQTG